MVMNLKNLFVKYIKLREKLDKSKIYKIVDNTNDNIYIGSTCKTLKTRLTCHKCHYKMFLKGLYGNVTSFEIIKNRDYKIELLEDCNIKTKNELLARERFFIENNECLNKVIPGRTAKQYYREVNKEKKDEYRETNKEKLREKFDCECGGQYSYNNKSRHLKSDIHLNFLECLK